MFFETTKTTVCPRNVKDVSSTTSAKWWRKICAWKAFQELNVVCGFSGDF